jgi:oxaloacetate decarboxylase alpha subunit
MPIGMMEAVLEDIDQAGFRSLCCPLMQLHFKKVIRDLKEDPWEMVRMFAKKAPRTKKGCILQPSLWPFDIVNFNREAVELYTKMLVDMGALQRCRCTGTSWGTSNIMFCTVFEKDGARSCLRLVLLQSPPAHGCVLRVKDKDDEDYGADVMYLNDAGGLLDIDNVRRSIP